MFELICMSLLGVAYVKARINEAKEEFRQAEEKLRAAKAKFSELLPKRDKKEFI